MKTFDEQPKEVQTSKTFKPFPGMYRDGPIPNSPNPLNGTFSLAPDENIKSAYPELVERNPNPKTSITKQLQSQGIHIITSEMDFSILEWKTGSEVSLYNNFSKMNFAGSNKDRDEPEKVRPRASTRPPGETRPAPMVRKRSATADNPSPPFQEIG
jgi:hypothetical protein